MDVLGWPLENFLGALKEYLREAAVRAWWKDRVLYAIAGGKTKPKPQWPLSEASD